VPARAGRS